MKIFCLFLCFLSSSTFGQSDSAYLVFKPQSEDYCKQLHPQNGWYKLPGPFDKKPLDIPGAIFIEPRLLLNRDSVLNTYAWRPEFESNPLFDYPTLYYTEISASEVNDLLKVTVSEFSEYAPKLTYRDVIKNPEYYEKHYGIIYDDNSVEERKAIERIEEEARQQRAREDSIRKAKCKERFGPECIGTPGIIDGVYTPTEFGRFYRLLPYESVHVENVKFVNQWHEELRSEQFQPTVNTSSLRSYYARSP